jgi:hypothetical protein
MLWDLSEISDLTAISVDEPSALGISLRAAAEIGHVDAVRQLLELQEAASYQTQTANAKRNTSKYLSSREIGAESLELVGICPTVPSPVPVFLAAVRQHEEVLALLLPGRDTYIQGLMTRARGIDLGCQSLIIYHSMILQPIREHTHKQSHQVPWS